jgi:NAD(P)H-dependent flavin oxidoreductase YrpB (nitropropane dioxygenase family)
MIIMQGGMGVGVSLSKLAGAVAAQGGIGVISAALPGYNREGFAENPMKANLEALEYHIKTAKSAAKNGGLVGVNIMCALNNYEDYVKCAVQSGADIIISGAGLPTNLPETAAQAASNAFDKNIKLAPIVSSKKATSILLKLWDKKFNRTADMVVIEGPKAGGHLGFSPADLEKNAPFDDEVKQILQEVSTYEEKYSRKIPVIFAGGVSTRQDVEHYAALGCAGVQISTLFVTTEECDAHENFKQAYVNAAPQDITIVKSPVGMPGRALNNAFIKKTAETPEKITHCINCITHCNPKTAPYCISRALINAAKGDIDNALIFCGANAGKITEISTVEKIMHELTEPCNFN